MTFVVLVQLHVRSDKVEAFLEGIEANARASLRDEPGCLQFDVHRVLDDPTRFLLYERYRDEAAFRHDHRSTPHYAAWQQVAARCLEPGGHHNIFAEPAFPADRPGGPAIQEGSTP